MEQRARSRTPLALWGARRAPGAPKRRPLLWSGCGELESAPHDRPTATLCRSAYVPELSRTPPVLQSSAPRSRAPERGDQISFVISMGRLYNKSPCCRVALLGLPGSLPTTSPPHSELKNLLGRESMGEKHLRPPARLRLLFYRKHNTRGMLLDRSPASLSEMIKASNGHTAICSP